MTSTLATVVAAAVLHIQPPDVGAALAADLAAPQSRGYRVAVAVPAAIDPGRHGTWTAAADGGQLWRLRVSADGARHLSFAFSQVTLPPGAELRLAGPAGEDPRGPYGPQDIVAGKLWTPVIRSADVDLELRVPAGTRGNLDLQLEQVNYGFRGFGTGGEKLRPCHIDVACPEGELWANEIRATAMIVTSGVFGCSGTLLNNTAGDFRPFFLTAAHCVSDAAGAATTTFYWNYENSVCGGEPDGRLDQTQLGSLLRASSLNAPITLSPDFALLELLELPAAEYGVFYAGWDNRDIEPTGVVGISHPSIEEKRISLDADTAIVKNGSGVGSTPLAPQPLFLYVEGWDQGTTEPGSSGSGLFNADHRLVGQLSTESTTAACGREENRYGRFHADWHGLATEHTSVASWLDPRGTGAEYLDGADPAADRKAVNRSDSPPAPAGAGATGALLVLFGLAFAIRLQRRNCCRPRGTR